MTRRPLGRGVWTTLRYRGAALMSRQHAARSCETRGATQNDTLSGKPRRLTQPGSQVQKQRGSVADLDDDLAAGLAAGEGGQPGGGISQRQDGFDVDLERAVGDLVGDGRGGVVQDGGRAQRHEPLGVGGRSGGQHGGSLGGEQLDGVGADAAGGAHEQDDLSRLGVDRVDGGGGGSPRQGQGGGGDPVQAGGLGGGAGGGQQRV